MLNKLYLVVLLSCGVLSTSESKSNQESRVSVTRNRYDTHTRIEADGYTAESHEVVTSDGYVLKIHRIPFGRDQEHNGTRTPVLIMHGITDSSMAFVQQGPEIALGYNLADAGFDVWLGNARGNRNSRSHITLNPDDSIEKFQFFDYSWDEMGKIDLAAMVDYVLETTGNHKLHYIGHSQGGTMFLVLNSLRPEYNGKFISAHLLAGVGYMEYFPQTLLAEVSRFVNLLHRIALRLGIVEVFPPRYSVSEILPFPRSALNCTSEEEVQELCDFLDRIDIEPRLGSGAGAALKQFVHFGQNIKSKLFQRFDHGILGNIFAYGNRNPPTYDIGLITVETVMHYTVADEILDERDVLNMVEKMPNTVARKVARDTFEHIDFVVADDIKELVNDFIIERMLRFADGQGSSPTPEPGAASTISLGISLLWIGSYYSACTVVPILCRRGGVSSIPDGSLWTVEMKACSSVEI